ncbi:prolyl 4-hydroxylase subunit alpha-2-like [Penaeus indicus]|uniref:prolyl 4-hydroxylase subunit alpha-2-like n=1 Tax=Penaeus indicus TaxID=29960 RepID=UPI00300D7097
MSGSGGDIFSATSKLEDLMSLEGEVVRMVDRYLQATLSKVELMTRYVQDFQRLRRIEEVAGGQRPVRSGAVDHPVDAYLLVKRLTVEWASLEDAITAHANYTQELVHRVVAFRERTSFPVMEDLHGAAVALVRLQDTYRLNMTSLSSGTLAPVTSATLQSSKPLNARDCLFLGKHAFNKGYYDKAIEWFEAALERSSSEEVLTAPKDEIEPFLQAAIKVHDDVLEKRGPRGTDWQTKALPVDKTLASKPKYLDATPVFVPKLYQQQSDEEEEEHYNRLCRGERLRDCCKPGTHGDEEWLTRCSRQRASRHITGKCWQTEEKDKGTALRRGKGIWAQHGKQKQNTMPSEKEIRTADRRLVEHSNIRTVAVHGTQEKYT